MQPVAVSVVPAADLGPVLRARLVALVNDAFAQHRWLFASERVDDEAFQAETEGSDLILVERGPEVVAMGLVREDPGAVYLGMVSVRAAEQGRGYGHAVLLKAEEIARRRGLTRVRLTTVPQLGNRTYWERHGFRVVREEAKDAGEWGAVQPWTLVTMEKPLPAS